MNDPEMQRQLERLEAQHAAADFADNVARQIALLEQERKTERLSSRCLYCGSEV